MATETAGRGPRILRIPEGDTRERKVCAECGFIAYENPKVVVGSVVTLEDRILLCRRAIEPRRGYWTLPAGYLELNESTAAGAEREAYEEARARIVIEGLLAVYDIPRISQVQVIYRARLADPAVAAGPESLEVQLFRWDDIPWQELAFPSVHWALHHFRDWRSTGDSRARANPPDATGAHEWARRPDARLRPGIGRRKREMSDAPSLLERMIGRLTAQRDLLAEAARLIQGIEGPVLEVGLGKGRTYDHLRRLLPGRVILAFDRDLHAPAAVAPPPERLFLGEFAETLPAAARRIGRVAALVHADFGSPDRAHDARQALRLGPLLRPLVRPGGLVLADRELAVEGWARLPLAATPDWPYFLWRVEG